MLRSCLRNRSVVPGLGPRDRHLRGATELGSLILALMLKGRVPTEECLSMGSRGLSQRPTCNNFHLIWGGCPENIKFTQTALGGLDPVPFEAPSPS